MRTAFLIIITGIETATNKILLESLLRKRWPARRVKMIKARLERQPAHSGPTTRV